MQWGDVRIDAAMAMAMGGLSRQQVDMAVRYEEFVNRACALGLTAEQAETIIRSEGLLTSISGRQGSADARLEYYACYGYLTVLLGEVLTREEMAEQPFRFETVLNAGSWMSLPYGKHFAGLDRDRQRGLVKAAIALTTELGGAKDGWPLERAMAAVMPYSEET
jgi:hypothetical protein